MSEMSYRGEGTVPVAQGVAPTAGAIAKVAVGSLMLMTALLVRGKAGMALSVAGGGLIYSSRRRRHVRQRSQTHIDALATITIDASPNELYERWRRLENLPNLFEHVLSVEDLGNGRSTWRVQAPLRRLEWDSRVTVDEPGRRIAWRSLPGGDLDHEGEVTFRPAAGDRGTVVTVRMRYAPPGGKLGAAVAGMFGLEPRQELREDLRRLKMLVETGEIATTIGQPAARVDSAGRAGRLSQRAADAVAVVRRPLQSQEAPR